MTVSSFYRRVLPSPPATDFTSSEGKQLFSEALQEGTMEGFFKLVSHYQTQSDPSFSGHASLSMVLNALAIDPGRTWKDPWRWFDEYMLDCCEPLDRVRAEGITFGKVACLAHCAGAKVEACRTNQSSIDEFRQHVIRCATSDDCHLIASYRRATLKQTGTDHFSPVGGYHAGRDMALILDVARFKYPPHWVPLSLLWEAMHAFDEFTGNSLGYMMISKFQKAPSLLYKLSCRNANWIDTVKYLVDDVPLLLKSEDFNTVSEVLSTIFSSLPSKVGDFIKWIAEVGIKEEDELNLSEEEKGMLLAKGEVLQRVRETKLFKLVNESSASMCCSIFPTFTCNDSLYEIADSVCCQGARLLTATSASNESPWRSPCIKCLKCKEDLPETAISSTVVSNCNTQWVGMLFPMSGNNSSNGRNFCPCNKAMMPPGSSDVLTVLLLALMPSTWLGIKEERLLKEILNVISTNGLPYILQEEVLHLQRRLYLHK